MRGMGTVLIIMGLSFLLQAMAPVAATLLMHMPAEVMNIVER